MNENAFKRLAAQYLRGEITSWELYTTLKYHSERLLELKGVMPSTEAK